MNEGPVDVVNDVKIPLDVCQGFNWCPLSELMRRVCSDAAVNTSSGVMVVVW